MQSATATTAAKRSKQRPRELGQFDLFAGLTHSAVDLSPADLHKKHESFAHSVTQSDPVQSSVAKRNDTSEAQSLPRKTEQRAGRQRPVRVHIVTESDLPHYSDEEKAIVDRTLEALPQTKAWFTYADIKQAFTISRATVVRRVKSGVVPGIRFGGDRVLEDGSIRRFTREQVRYLLLAIRRPARQ